MLLYLNTKIAQKLDADIIFISIINYIFSVALLKFIENKNGMIGFFNIYIFLIILVDFTFTLYHYIISNVINISSIDLNNNNFQDDIITSNFNMKRFKKDIKKFKKPSKTKIISKKSETNTDIKEFNKEIQKFINDDIKTDNISDIKFDKKTNVNLDINEII